MLGRVLYQIRCLKTYTHPFPPITQVPPYVCRGVCTGSCTVGHINRQVPFHSMFSCFQWFRRETVSLFLHFTVNPKPPVGFLDVPRCSMTGKEQTVCRLIELNSSCLPSSGSCIIYWSGSSRLRVGGDTVAPRTRSGQLKSSDTFKCLL